MTYKNEKYGSTAPGVAISLKRLAFRHIKKLCITFLLVITENVAFLLYPVLAGVAINAILAGQTARATIYGLLVLFMWCIGAARRSVDTRTFARIYASLAVTVVLGKVRTSP